MRAKVVNLYGDEAAPPEAALRPTGEAFVRSGEFAYDLFPARPLGAHRVEVWVEDAAGARISPVAEVVVNRVQRPRYWGVDAPQSAFGGHFTATPYDIAMAKAIGINWIRLHDFGMYYSGWRWLEPQKGTWTFADNKIDRLRRGKVSILGLLSTTPPWATVLPNGGEGYWGAFGQPKDYDEFASYVTRTVEHYRGRIAVYEVWNEPWISEFWSAGAGTPYNVHSADPQGDYARLTKRAYEAAKAVDPSIAIIGLNTTANRPEPPRIIGGHDWTTGMMKHDFLKHSDVISYHNYMGGLNGFAGDGVDQGFDYAFKPLMNADGQLPKPVWMTEGNSGGYPGTGFYRHTLVGPNYEDGAQVADNLCRYVLSMMGRGVEKVFLYSMTTRGSHWATLVNFDGTLNPSGVAFAHMAWQLEDLKFVRRIEPMPDVTAFLFAGAGRSVAVLAPRGSVRAQVLPNAVAGCTVTDLWGNALPAGATFDGMVVYVATAGPVDAIERAIKP